MFAPKVAKPQTKAPANSTNSLARKRPTPMAGPFGYLMQQLSNPPAKAPSEHRPPEAARVTGEAPSAAWDFNKIPFGYSPDRATQAQARSSLSAPRLPGTIQPKLVVGQANDPLEHEADRVAEQVMRMPYPGPAISTAGLRLSRACGACEEKLQRDAVSPTAPNSQEAPSIVRDVMDQPGRSLDASSRAFFEPRFGLDLGHVRLHDDTQAARSARMVGARAFAVGDHIAFAERVDTASESGRYLLAHELTHVVQQSGSTGVVQRLIREPYPWQGIITPAIGAHVRSSPTSSSPTNILDSLPRGQIVTVVARSGNWLRVQSHYRGPLLEGYVYNTLVDDATAASMAGSVGTTMVWKPSAPGSGTDFETWASAPKEKPFPAVTATTVMNCWEAVLLSAYRAGAITWAWIHNLYTTVPMADWVTAMSRRPLHTYAVPGPNAIMPQRGDIVFFDGIAHVALATGSGSDVYTFWPPPNTPFTPGGTTDKVKVFTIEALVAWWSANLPPAPTVQFGAPRW